MAGSLVRFLCSTLALSSRDEVPAGVNGGECMADAGDDGMEERWPECAEAVREAGVGDAALCVLVLSMLMIVCCAKWLAYSGRRKRNGFEGEVLHALCLHSGLLECGRQITQLFLGLGTQRFVLRVFCGAREIRDILHGLLWLDFLVDIAEADRLRWGSGRHGW
jgi:hypothetical protein